MTQLPEAANPNGRGRGGYKAADVYSTDPKAAAATELGEEEEEDEESWDEDWDDIPYDTRGRGAERSGGARPNGAQNSAVARHANMQRLQARVNFDSMPARQQMSHAARNSAMNSEKKADAPKNLGLTQDTRATVDQVLDPRT